ncbi:hypothetical protein G6O69_00280 [Pseudenhygromyxa sp. WMMC2535]|uniref:esterase/lipase family protein n=1 Tax=Pseudenhygromyxa sp. WMMC2535 TaxID=2712867 RepID=UPI0015535FFF|nr:hypothetical protein [Pseudenhygromyxa sp. WMMC2535]NVB36246.1 hypothetical protein [Pseudenhygromyxa sp. WMMC2535]
MSKQHVVLVPGFFGFVNFGRLVYFAHVRELLQRAFESRGLDVEIHRVRTGPVASLRQRAGDLAEVIRTEIPPGEPLHVIGHSSGGLDARLMTSPGVNLGPLDVESIARHVRSVITICTPHRGSPLSDHFVGLIGEPLLRTFSLLTVIALRQGRLPARLAFRFARALVGERLMPGTPIHVVLETLEQEAIAELQRNEDRLGGGALSVADFMSELRTEAHLIPQLMPAACDLFNAAVSDRPETFYGCVIARAPAPVLRSHLALGLSPYDQATHALFRWLRLRSAPMPKSLGRAPDQAQSKLMRATWGEVARAEDTDGMVPTRSQLHGELLHAATADHLDVIGHLHEPEHNPPHFDWIASGSGFSREDFEALWGAVAARIISL